MTLLALLACGVATKSDDTASADTATATCNPGEECCLASELPAFNLCVDALGPEDAYVGTFRDWDRDGALTFTTTVGDDVPVRWSGDAEAFDLLPDLSTAGEVTLSQSGYCDPKSGAPSEVHVTGPTGDTLLLTGGSSIDDFGGWTVHTRDTEACPDEASGICWEYLRAHPVTFTHGAASATLWMGEERTLDGRYTLRLSRAYTGRGDMLCDDVAQDYTSYWVTGPG